MNPRIVAAAAICLVIAAVAVTRAQRDLPVRAGKVQRETPDVLENWRKGDSFEAVYFPKARASSSLGGKNGVEYGVGKLQDGDLSTAWIEGAKGTGAGEWLEFTFDRTGKQDGGRTGVAVTQLAVMNGYRKTRGLWRKNGRVRRMRLSVDGRPTAVLALADAYAHQMLPLPKIPLPPRRKTVVRLTLLDAYPGARYQDTGISELEFVGEGVF